VGANASVYISDGQQLVGARHVSATALGHDPAGAPSR
jgi:hypothetical protein